MAFLAGIVVLFIVVSICSASLDKSMAKTKRQEELQSAINSAIDRDRMISRAVDQDRTQRSTYRE